MFQTILFDIDGVMLSEERYFDASALTVYELLFSKNYLGLAVPGTWPAVTMHPSDDVIQAVRKAVFHSEAVLFRMKQAGINANWDMVYLQTALQLSAVVTDWVEKTSATHVRDVCSSTFTDGWTVSGLKCLGEAVRRDGVVFVPDFGSYLAVTSDATSKAQVFDVVESCLARAFASDLGAELSRQTLWNLGKEVFQSWYLGDEYCTEGQPTGKQGFLKDEIPLVAPEAFSRLLSTLQNRGCTLGIGTGRPSIETVVPLRSLGWLNFFAHNRVSTASDVLQAEARVKVATPLGKPHPYSYLRSLMGIDDPEVILATPLPLSEERRKTTLVIGDSVADLLAARTMGTAFAAVLTGVEGQKARPQFEALHADFIWDDVLGLASLL